MTVLLDDACDELVQKYFLMLHDETWWLWWDVAHFRICTSYIQHTPYLGKPSIKKTKGFSKSPGSTPSNHKLYSYLFTYYFKGTTSEFHWFRKNPKNPTNKFGTAKNFKLFVKLGSYSTLLKPLNSNIKAKSQFRNKRSRA